MQEAIIIWLALTCAMGAMATITIWSRVQTKLRGLSVLGFLLVVPISAPGFAYVLGWPVPRFAAFGNPGGDYAILGTKMIAGEAIYVLLDTGDVPRYFAFPWDKKMSDKIQELLDSEGGKEGMRMKLPPFEFSWEKREPPEVYALPQPKVMPDKPRQAEQPKRFDSI
jgi:hypothetical protein